MNLKKIKAKKYSGMPFHNRNNLDLTNNFSETVNEVQKLLEPVYQAAVKSDKFQLKWLAEEYRWGK